ncbi:FadR family transcriptional regulator [Mesorhizobium plurifarium]|uniref:FadR/GntR family transcriptional regulator n=1 Tax=Sinorhizobium arboris TaxID=76745 RepID=UPI00040C2932|nr:FadR/GntR family transcriptional regulator [Sinorhizobium arboris]PST23835.1 FadR family transcriptional regulator [Mesorhizobium plurifarium]
MPGTFGNQRGKRTSHRLVVDGLGQAVIGGEFAVGDTLPGDADLAARFNVSRTVLREAMKTLAAKGLVVARARIGTRVLPRAQWNLFDSDVLTWHFGAGVDEDFLRHVSEVRLALEPYAAALAARRASDVDIARMMRLAVAMGDAGHTPHTLAHADLEFHLRLLEASLNPFMRTVGSLIEAALMGVFQLTSPTADETEIDRVAIAHIRIVEEIRRRNEEGARSAMEHVIRVGQERLIMNLRGRES